MFDINPNWFAYFALLVWPVVALYLYTRLPLGRATLWTILGGYLLLPVGTVIKIPMVPGAFEKLSIPNLAAFGCCAFYSRRFPKIFQGFGIVEILVLGIVIGPFISSALNSDPIRIGSLLQPGVGAYDAGSAALFNFIFILPFFLGRQFLRRPEDNADILRILVIAGLAYSLPMLLEIRMSPQLHTWIYGYFPHSFLEQMRDGGFRPVVFLGHGLLVAFFTLTATLAAAALWRTRTPVGHWSPSWVTGYLSFIILLCKTGNAILYGVLLLPLVRWAKPRLQVRIACALVTVTLAYPLLRAADLVPTTYFLEAARAVSADRGASLATRFFQEHMLLDHAWERPWFGWGRFGRGRVYSSDGIDISITDGWWINIMADFGLVGFFANFGLLSLSVFRAAAALKYGPTMREREYLAALALIVAINIFDLLPNSPISPWTWLLVGSLLGRTEALRTMVRQQIPAQDLDPSPIGVRRGQN
jgi:hypothetical protein